MHHWNRRLLLVAWQCVAITATADAGFPVVSTEGAPPPVLRPTIVPNLVGQAPRGRPQGMPYQAYQAYQRPIAPLLPITQQPLMTAPGAVVRPVQVANPFVYEPRQSPLGNHASRSPFSPAQASQYLAEAVRFESQNNLRMAINSYHRALECEPTNRLALISFARMKHRIGDLDGAIVTYRQSLKYHPNDPVALNDLGLCHARRGEIKQALVDLAAASRLVPESKLYANNFATVLVEDGNHAQARAVLETAYGPALGHFNLAMMLRRRGKLVAAGEHVRQALHLDPSLLPARQLLSELGGHLTAETPRIASLSEPAPGDAIERSVMGEVAPEPAATGAAEATMPIMPESAKSPADLQLEQSHRDFLDSRSSAMPNAE